MKSVKIQIRLDALYPAWDQVREQVDGQVWEQIRYQIFGEVEFGSVVLQVLNRIRNKMKYVL